MPFPISIMIQHTLLYVIRVCNLADKQVFMQTKYNGQINKSVNFASFISR